MTDRAGFALAPILYMLGLIGVSAGVLFSGYSQVIRSNIAITDSIAVKNDLNAANQVLAGSSKLGTDGVTLCPPPGSSPGSACSGVSAKMTNLSAVSSGDVHLPTIYSGGSAIALTQNAEIGISTPAKEVGAFTAGSGIKQLDPWGHYYIYCRWENSTTSGATSPAIMVISAGSDGELETTCDAAVAGTSCNLKSGCDDVVYAMNVGTTINHSTLWTAGTATVGSSTVADVTYGSSPLTVDANGNLTVPGTSLLEGVVTTNNAVNAGNNVTVAGNLTGATGGTLAIGSSTTVAGQLTTTGSVGIGTSSPGYSLSVNANTAGNNGINIANAGGNSQISFDSPLGTEKFAITNVGNSYLAVFASGQGNILNVTSGGFVGINATTPKSSLDVNGNAAIGSYAGSTAAPSNGLIVSGNVGIGTSSPGQTLEVNGKAKLDAGLITGLIYPAADSTIAIQVDKANGTSNVMDIDTTDGYVGIGTTSPSGKLDVEGSGGVILNAGGVGIGTSSTLTYSPNLAVQGSGGIYVEPSDFATTAQNAYLSLTKTGGSYGQPATIQAGDGHQYDAILINPLGGNVGIGTSSASTTLQVNGTITGTIPVADLNSGTGASSSTFWRGDGTWATPTVALGTSTTGTLPVGSLSGTPSGGSGPYNQVYVNAQGLVTAESYTAITSSQWVNGSSGAIYYSGGNVGIGTAGPVVPLQIASRTSILDNVMYDEIALGNNNIGGTIMVIGRSADTSGWNGIQSISSQGSTYGNLVLNPGGGYVGIGTSNPGAVFTVGNNAFEVNANGTVLAGTWQAANVGLGYGGTGGSTAPAGLSNLLGNPSAGSYAINCSSSSSCATIAATSAGVTSFSAGTTGLTPSTATTGAITLSGILAVANGGTGVTTSTGTGSVVLSGSPTLTGTVAGASSNWSGYVGIGTTSPRYMLDLTNATETNQLHLSGTGNDNGGYIFGYGTNNAYLSGGIAYNGSNWIAKDTNGSILSAGLGGFQFYVAPSLTVGSTAPLTQVMSMDSAGTFYVGTSTAVAATSRMHIRYAGSTAQYGIEFQEVSSGGCAAYFVYTNGTYTGEICDNGAGGTAYNSASDRRLKENIAPSSRGLDAVLKIPVTEFNFIFDQKKTRTQGFIAQDLYKVYPEAVTVGGEDVKKRPWSIDYGRLTPLAIKAVQDLKALFDADHDLLVAMKSENNKLCADQSRQIQELHEEFEAYKASHP